MGNRMFDRLIWQIIREVFGAGKPAQGFDEPFGDPGIFGPSSVAWEIHADFVPMLIGGISALIMQSLHPDALAGVWDHSNFRQDIKGRLNRTASFIAATTYGPAAMAMGAIERVKSIHEKIIGLDEFSRPYRANDPHLLAWVHLVETTCFLRAFVAYNNPHLSRQRQDLYFAEMRLIGESLGCQNLPANYAQAYQRIFTYRDELYYGERAKVVVDLLENYPVTPLFQPFFKLIMRAALMNLPDWALTLIGHESFAAYDRTFVTLAVRALSRQARSTLGDATIAARAMRRMTAVTRDNDAFQIAS